MNSFFTWLQRKKLALALPCNYSNCAEANYGVHCEYRILIGDLRNRHFALELYAISPADFFREFHQYLQQHI